MKFHKRFMCIELDIYVLISNYGGRKLKAQVEVKYYSYVFSQTEIS